MLQQTIIQHLQTTIKVKQALSFSNLFWSKRQKSIGARSNWAADTDRVVGKNGNNPFGVEAMKLKLSMDKISPINANKTEKPEQISGMLKDIENQRYFKLTKINDQRQENNDLTLKQHEAKCEIKA